MHMGAYPLSTALLTLPNSASLNSCTEHALFIHFLFCHLSSLSKILWLELLHGSMDGCQELARMLYFIICWYVFIIIRTFLGLRECFPFF